MNNDGFREFREIGDGNSGGGVWWRNNQTMVPVVGRGKIGVIWWDGDEGSNSSGGETGGGDVEDRDWLAAEAFGKEEGVYPEAVERLLKSRSYVLEMNSF